MSQSLARRLVPALAAAVVLLALTVLSAAFASTASAHAVTHHQQIARSAGAAGTGAQSEGDFTVPLTCYSTDGIVSCASLASSTSAISTGASSQGSFSVPLTCFRQADGIVLCAYPGKPRSAASR